MKNWQSIAVKIGIGVAITLGTLLLVKKVDALRRIFG